MTENKYQLGKIYKLTSEHTNKIYIGSTCEKLSRRLICHISHHKRWKNGNGRYITSFVLFELGLVQITLLENCNCDTKNELLSKERYWIEHHRDIIVNKYIPTKTDEELREQRNELTKQYNNVNKYKIKQYKKEYRENNKEKLKEQQRQYREIRKQKINNKNV